MSGPTESVAETTSQRLASFEKILNEYTSKIGIGFVPYSPVEVQNILDMDFQKISDLTEDECAAHSFVLSKFALHIRKEQNRQKVRVEWAKSGLNGLLAKYGSKYGNDYVKYEMKLAAMCNEDSAAAALNKIVLHANARFIDLDGIADQLNSVSKTINDSRQTKRKFYGNTTRTD